MCATPGCPALCRGFYCEDCAWPTPALIVAVNRLVQATEDDWADRWERVRLRLTDMEPMFEASEHPPFYELINHDRKTR